MSAELDAGSEGVNDGDAAGDDDALALEVAEEEEEEQAEQTDAATGSSAGTALFKPPAAVPALDALAKKKAAKLAEYADSEAFEVLPLMDPLVEMAKLVTKDPKTTYPVVRGRYVFDSAELPGDPKDEWAVYAEIAATMMAWQSRQAFDDLVYGNTVLMQSREAVVVWLATRKNAMDLIYDYVLGTTLQATDGRLTLARFGLPPDMVKKLKVPGGPGYQRTDLHCGGFDIKKIGDTETGLKIQITIIVHTELAKVPFFIPGSLIVPTLMQSTRGIPTRVKDSVAQRVRPIEVRSGAHGIKETLFDLPAVAGKPLRVPHYAYQALAPKMRQDASSSEPLAPPRCNELNVLGEAVANENVDEVAKQALKLCGEYCSSDKGWSNEDVGMNQDGIVTSSRAVAGFKWPAYRCKLTIDVPERFNGNLRLAAFEAIAPWVSWPISRQLEAGGGGPEQSAALAWTKGGASVAWVMQVPDGDPKVKPVHLVLARGLEAKVGKTEVVIRHACASVPEEVAKALLAGRTDLVSHDRERYQLNSTQVRVFEDKGKAKVEVQSVLHMEGLTIPSMLPKFLVKKDLLMNSPGQVCRWRTLYSEGCIPRLIEISGSHPAPRIPPMSVSVAGETWMVCSSIREPLREVLDGL